MRGAKLLYLTEYFQSYLYGTGTAEFKDVLANIPDPG